MSRERNNYLLKNTAIFTLGNLATKFVSFFLIPLYTNALSTYDYGKLDLIITIVTVAIPILTLNIMESVLRFNLDKGVDNNIITKIGITMLFVSIIIGLAIIPICNMFITLSDLSIYIYIYCISSAANQIFLCDLRGKEMLLQYSIGSVINTLLIGVLNVLFLLVFECGLKGFLLAYSISNIVTLIYAMIIGKGYKAFPVAVDKKKMVEMLKYSIVLIPNSFMWWIMNSSDHLMVTSMLGLTANGIYAISYKLPTLISNFTGIFNQAWSYSAIKEDVSDDIEMYTNSVFRKMICVIMTVGIGMMTFIKPFLKIYVQEDYYIAWRYCPFLIIGCVYLTLGTFMSTSYTVHKDSKGFLFSGTIGAIINVVLNWVLIPVWGTYGAAFATCISYITVFIFRLFHTRKYLKYRVNTNEFLCGSIAIVISAILIYVDNITSQIAQIVIFIIVLYFFKNIWIDFSRKIINRVFRR